MPEIEFSIAILPNRFESLLETQTENHERCMLLMHTASASMIPVLKEAGIPTCWDALIITFFLQRDWKPTLSARLITIGHGWSGLRPRPKISPLLWSKIYRAVDSQGYQSKWNFSIEFDIPWE